MEENSELTMAEIEELANSLSSEDLTDGETPEPEVKEVED
jgi:hypothetical protein